MDGIFTAAITGAPFVASYAVTKARKPLELILVFATIAAIYFLMWNWNIYAFEAREHAHPVDSKEDGLAVFIWAFISIIVIAIATTVSADKQSKIRKQSVIARIMSAAAVMSLTTFCLLVVLYLASLTVTGLGTA